MTPEQYVKLFYPDADCEYSNLYKKYCIIAEIEGEQTIIGDSEFFESIAWKDAYNEIKKQLREKQFKNETNNSNL